MKKQGAIQGEGDYEAAKHYNEAQKKFVESGGVEKAAQEAEPKSEKEADDLARAEAKGRSRAKEEDPAVHRDEKQLKGQTRDPRGRPDRSSSK
jgi:hypothetical protein